MDGIDVPKVTEWLEANVNGAKGPFEFDFISGGRSNLTFGVTGSDGRKFVLRRPPMSHVLATAHDMGREHKIISALHDTEVPVPNAVGICQDAEVNGAPFYVMDFVEGNIVRDPRLLDEKARRVASEDLVDVLSAIHAVDVDAVGLGDLGRRSGYIERQLKRWHGQFQQSQKQQQEGGFGRPVPVVDEVHELLAKQIPPEHETTIAHGDYRLDNCIVGDDGRVRAVLDWELCTLGVPLADLGTLSIYWAGPTTATPGFLTREELAERYAAVSGRDVSDLPYYVAFGHWKLACIVEGVYTRYAAGAMGGDASAAEGFAGSVFQRAEQAKKALAQL
jgi:aminoglycoside phosphotransferase (APT) family kinase protein